MLLSSFVGYMSQKIFDQSKIDDLMARTSFDVALSFTNKVMKGTISKKEKKTTSNTYPFYIK